MITVFRLEQKRYAKEAYSGFGAKLRGARWHKRGHEAVYTSWSRSLCALERLVQSDPEEIPDLICVPAKIPKDVFNHRSKIGIVGLPENWRSYPPPPILQHIGTRWIENGESAVLEVPSAIIPEEHNFLLNPNHDDFAKIEVCPTEKFTVDPRLLK